MLFQDRREAGRKLAEVLTPYKDKNPIVLALPRGGVPVGYEIAKALKFGPLDIKFNEMGENLYNYEFPMKNENKDEIQKKRREALRKAFREKQNAQKPLREAVIKRRLTGWGMATDKIAEITNQILTEEYPPAETITVENHEWSAEKNKRVQAFQLFNKTLHETPYIYPMASVMDAGWRQVFENETRYRHVIVWTHDAFPGIFVGYNSEWKKAFIMHCNGEPLYENLSGSTDPDETTFSQ